jgi:hypothetical protein
MAWCPQADRQAQNRDIAENEAIFVLDAAAFEAAGLSDRFRR